MCATFFLLALLTTPVNYACQLCMSIIDNYQAPKKLSIIEICLSNGSVNCCQGQPWPPSTGLCQRIGHFGVLYRVQRAGF